MTDLEKATESKGAALRSEPNTQLLAAHLFLTVFQGSVFICMCFKGNTKRRWCLQALLLSDQEFWQSGERKELKLQVDQANEHKRSTAASRPTEQG